MTVSARDQVRHAGGGRGPAAARVGAASGIPNTGAVAGSGPGLTGRLRQSARAAATGLRVGAQGRGRVSHRRSLRLATHRARLPLGVLPVVFILRIMMIMARSPSLHWQAAREQLRDSASACHGGDRRRSVTGSLSAATRPRRRRAAGAARRPGAARRSVVFGLRAASPTSHRDCRGSAPTRSPGPVTD